MFVDYNVNTRQIKQSAWLALRLPTTCPPHHFICSLNAFCIYCNGTGHKIHIPSFPDSYLPLASPVPLLCFPPFLYPLHFFLFGNLEVFPSRANGHPAIANHPWKWYIREPLLLLISEPHSEAKNIPACKAWALSCPQGHCRRVAIGWGGSRTEGKSLWCPKGCDVSVSLRDPRGGVKQHLGTKLVAVCFPFSLSRPRPTSGNWTSGWTKLPLTKHPS